MITYFSVILNSFLGVDRIKKRSIISEVFNNKEVMMRSVVLTDYFRITREKKEEYYFNRGCYKGT